MCVCYVQIHSPIRVYHWENKEIKLVQQVLMLFVCHKISQNESESCWTNPLPGMDTCKRNGLTNVMKTKGHLAQVFFWKLPPSRNMAGLELDCLRFLKQ